MVIIQIMLMSHLKQTPGVCPPYPLVPPGGVMGVTPTITILRCHLIQMGPYKNQDPQLEATPEVTLSNIQPQQDLVTAFLGIPMGGLTLMGLGAMGGFHPHPLQDMVPMIEEGTMEDRQNFHQIITSCHPRESTVEKLSVFSLITTTNNKKPYSSPLLTLYIFPNSPLKKRFHRPSAKDLKRFDKKKLSCFLFMRTLCNSFYYKISITSQKKDYSEF